MKSFFRILFDPWVIFGSLILTALLFGSFMLFFIRLRANTSRSLIPTAILNVIVAPTFTPIPPTITPSVGSEISGNPFPTPQAGDIHKGTLVQVKGTQGDGLRLRVEPGLESEVKFLAFEAEVFRVEDGPQEKLGYTWWFLVALYDDSLRGWAVSNFLSVVQQP